MSFHYHSIQLSRNTLRVFAPRGRTLATTAGTTTKTATLHRCPCARAQTSITSFVANGASATYDKNNQILLRELLSLRLIRLKALVFLAGAFFILEVFDCSFYSTGRFIATQKAPAHFCATARNVGPHNQILLVRKLCFHELLSYFRII